jgi:hypothetical protein
MSAPEKTRRPKSGVPIESTNVSAATPRIQRAAARAGAPGAALVWSSGERPIVGISR